jgi:signal transduction histidine kinase
MNSRTINELRRKFILIATVSFFVVILFTAGMTTLASENSLRLQAGRALSLIVENDGQLPDAPGEGAGSGSENPLDRHFVEFTYAARYFSVVYDADGNVRSVDVSRVALVSEQEAIVYAEAALESYENPTVSLLDLGQVDTFYYRVAAKPDGNTIVAFLDCSFQVQVNREVGRNTIFICIAGIAGSFVIVLSLSNRAIKPSIENARKQKQFITNASHELKTPLAVIRANTEVIEMLSGESEWTRSTMSQVDRMDGLVQNLVMIARAQEREDRDTMGEIDVCSVVTDSVEPFQALARQDEIDLVCDLEGEVTMVGDVSSIQQLTTLLVDNAIKYCDKGGKVVVELVQPRRGRVTLTVSNTFAKGERAEFDRYFERFYRDDESHSDEGGYGIGLSVAESICERYRGSIRAMWKGGMAVFTCQLRSA